MIEFQHAPQEKSWFAIDCNAFLQNEGSGVTLTSATFVIQSGLAAVDNIGHPYTITSGVLNFFIDATACVNNSVSVILINLTLSNGELIPRYVTFQCLRL